MGCKHFLTILDDGFEVGTLIRAVPAVVSFRGTEEVTLGQEVGSGGLQDTALLQRAGGQEVVCLLEVGDDLLVAVVSRGTREVSFQA